MSFLRKIVFVSVVCGLCGHAVRAVAGELPADAKTVVNKYEAEIENLRKGFAKELQDWRDSLTAELKDVQKGLAADDQLDEAILVRTVVRVLELESGSDSTASVPKEQFNKLPKEAQKVLLKRESPGSVESRMEKEAIGKREQFLKQLAEMQSSYTKQEKLDEAVAIRDWLRSFSGGATATDVSIPARKSVKFVIPDITKGTKSLDDVRNKQRQTYLAMLTWQQAELLAASNPLLDKLKKSQLAHTKAGRLDEALEIRKFVETVSAEPAGGQRYTLIRNLKAKLPGDTALLADGFVEEAVALQAVFEENRKLLDGMLVKPMEERAKEVVLGNDVEVARKAINELFQLNQRTFDYHWAGHNQKPLKLISPAADVFKELAEEAGKLREKFLKDATPLREQLAEKLKKIEEGNLKAEEEFAVRRTLEQLTSRDFDGLRGLMLFYVDPDLKGEAAEIVTQFQRETNKMLEESRDALNAFYLKLRPRLDEARKAHLEVPDWHAAFSVLLQMQISPRLFEPLLIKYGQGDHFPWSGSIVEVRDGVYLVVNVHKHEEWMTRDRIRFADEKFPVTPNSKTGEYGPPPSFPVTDKTKLKPGRILLFKDNNRWVLVEVKELRDDIPVIHFLGHSNAWDKTVKRADLRIMTAD